MYTLNQITDQGRIFKRLKIREECEKSAPSYLAQCQFNVGKLLLESLIHVLLQVRWFHVFNDRRLQRWKNKTAVSIWNSQE